MFEIISPRERVPVRRVTASSFTMGTERGREDERPERQVEVSDFFIHDTEVTVEVYASCVEDGHCEAPAIGEKCNWGEAGTGQHPVNCVSWYDAVRYCDWAGGRLPTEAEWEKASRGDDGRVYPWGNDRPDCDKAIIGSGLGCGEVTTWPVGSRPAGDSPYGVSDLAGNVWEWTLDTYDSEAYARLDSQDPVNLEDDRYRVLRGNSWYYSDPPLDTRTTNRYYFRPARYYPYIGFRCVFPGTNDPIRPDVSALLDGEPFIGSASRLWQERNIRARRAEGEAAFDLSVRSQEMIPVPAGEFRMGSETGQSDERPPRDVWIDAFQIDRFEVSVSEYADCVREGGCGRPYSGGAAFVMDFESTFCNWGNPQRQNHPMNCVNWFEAKAFCGWAGKRLPREAEWEKAARGTDGRTYPWGDEQPDCDRAVIDAGGDGCGRDSTWPVGSKPMGASPYGVEDMSGNVWEWVEDWYGHGYYSVGPNRNPENTSPATNPLPGEATGKTLRGASWADMSTSLHSATNRLGYPENTFPDYTIGFRCAQDLTP